ncbi:hypothetical protein AB0K14_00510 [Actinosynnema sp. NPDC050801]|uniref:hypothetical protein n=1 Tax=unclassified Actinosynnema TaxID=2637065 RepID=UPI0033E61817
MDDFYLDLLPLGAIVLGLFALGFWWNRRRERKEEREQAESLASLATTLGGRVAGPDDVLPWSAELLEPLRDETDGMINRMGTASRPAYVTALDFRRGRWSVRVTEATVEKSIDNGTRTAYEQRIEVATSPLVPMRISRRVYGAKNFLGRALPPDNALAQGGELVREVPVTVAREHGQWVPARFPPGPLDAQFAVFTSDPAAAAGLLNPRAVEWLLNEGLALPSPLHFEAGLVFGTTPNRINPDHLPASVDVILGLLDRMGVSPAR